MKFGELLTSVSWPEAEKQLLRKYPHSQESIEGYISVFRTLQQSEAMESDMRIVIQRTFREEIDESPFTEVIGRNGMLNKALEDFKYLEELADSEYANSETDYALSLTPWEEWLGMEMDDETAENYTATQIVAHCLWEMTSLGFEQSRIQAKREELKRRVDKLNVMTEEEKKEHLIPWEEIKKELKKRLSS